MAGRKRMRFLCRNWRNKRKHGADPFSRVSALRCFQRRRITTSGIVSLRNRLLHPFPLRIFDTRLLAIKPTAANNKIKLDPRWCGCWRRFALVASCAPLTRLSLLDVVQISRIVTVRSLGSSLFHLPIPLSMSHRDRETVPISEEQDFKKTEEERCRAIQSRLEELFSFLKEIAIEIVVGIVEYIFRSFAFTFI